MTTTKISTLCLYQRIFISPKFRYALYSMMGIVAMWLVAGSLVTIFQCRPVGAAWDKRIQTYYCINAYPMYEGVLISDLLTDVIMLVLPMPLVWNLQLPKLHKLAILGIFTLGGLTCVVCLLRIMAFVDIPHTADLSLIWLQCSLWTVLEPILALAATSLPTLRPIIPRCGSSRTPADSSSSSGRGTTRSHSSIIRKSWYGVKNRSSSKSGGFDRDFIPNQTGGDGATVVGEVELSRRQSKSKGRSNSAYPEIYETELTREAHGEFTVQGGHYDRDESRKRSPGIRAIKEISVV